MRHRLTLRRSTLLRHGLTLRRLHLHAALALLLLLTASDELHELFRSHTHALGHLLHGHLLLLARVTALLALRRTHLGPLRGLWRHSLAVPLRSALRRSLRPLRATLGRSHLWANTTSTEARGLIAHISSARGRRRPARNVQTGSVARQTIRLLAHHG